jgi:hypothetical protein
MDSRYYPGVEADVSRLVAELRNIFDQDYEVQTMHVSATTVVQARKSSTLRDLTGLSAALTIKVTRKLAARAWRLACRSGSTSSHRRCPRAAIRRPAGSAAGAGRLLAIQTYRTCLEDSRRSYCAQSGWLCSTFARPLRKLRRR